VSKLYSEGRLDGDGYCMSVYDMLAAHVLALQWQFPAFSITPSKHRPRRKSYRQKQKLVSQTSRPRRALGPIYKHRDSKSRPPCFRHDFTHHIYVDRFQPSQIDRGRQMIFKSRSLARILRNMCLFIV